MFLLLCAAPVIGQKALQEQKPEAVGLSSERLGRIDVLMNRMVDEKKMAGGIVLVARQGKIAYLKAFGLADHGKTMVKDTLFRIASMSKPFTSMAIMLLYEEGRILLSDPISKYIPEFKNPKVIEMLPKGQNPPFKLVPAKREITIRDLLSHTSGLSYRFLANWYPDPKHRQLASYYKEAGISDGLSETDGTIGDMVKTLARLPLYAQPGDVFEYGLSADVLGYLVEVVSGMTLADFMHQRIFQPLKMNDTYFYPPEEKLGRLSAVWISDGNGRIDKMTDGIKQEGDYVYSPSYQYKGPKTYYSGGGGLVSTASDYFRFCQMLLNQGELDGVRLLSRKTVELMTATNHIGDSDAKLLHGKGWKFGLGFAIETDRGGDIDGGSVGVYEWAGIFSTRFSIDPREKKITIFLSQTHPFALHFGIWDTITVLSNSAIID
ncbi:MAG: beta-lactamase family protein [Candidatus Riflebacteria bacterium]|nr:beta-lactamase family protein [Candidatus Riflebacteria bacterium]